MFAGKIGRPPVFNTEEEMQCAIENYFKECDTNEASVASAGAIIKVPDPLPYTICGLAVFLGITRETLIQYGKEDRFPDTVKRAKAAVMANQEIHMLKSKNATGHIFSFKNNHGWVDKTEVDSTNRNLEITVADEETAEKLKDL